MQTSDTIILIGNLYRVLDMLPRRRNVAATKMRYGLHPYNAPMKYKDIGRELGVSGSRARALDMQTERALRHPIRERSIFLSIFPKEEE